MQFGRALTIVGMIACALVTAQPAGAVTVDIFSDDFNRANSTTVGNGWVEGPGISVNSNSMLFDGNGPFTATQGMLTLSTVGFTDLTLSYKWSSSGGEPPDQLLSFWSQDGGTTLNALGTHALNNANSFTSASFNLPAGAQNLADITLVFQYTGNMGNDSARVDDVRLQGVAAVPGPIVGAGLPGLIVACGGLLALARRRKANAALA